MKTACSRLREHIAQVLIEWDCLAKEHPWIGVPADRRFAMPTELVLDLIEAAVCAPVSDDAHRRKVYRAAEHGSNRRENGFDAGILTAELLLLREAFWRTLKRDQGVQEPEKIEAILFLDAAFCLVTRASMAGYYRPEYEAMQSWPRPLDEMIADSPLLRLGRSPAGRA